MPAITVPKKEGYIFNGYYDANDVKYYNADGTSAKNWDKYGDATLYAKWIEGSDAFGTRGVYMRNIKTENGMYRIHIFSGIDSLKYKEVGFEVEVDGQYQKLTTNVVFKKVVASNGTVMPSNLGNKCTAIFAHTITFPASYKDQALTYRAYAIDRAGNKIYGKSFNIDKIYNK